MSDMNNNNIQAAEATQTPKTAQTPRIPSPRIQAHFDCLVDQFDEGFHRDDVREELIQNLNRFLASGIDANRLASMMHPIDVVKHYAALARHGADIDPLNLVKAMEPAYVYLNFGRFVATGLNPNELFLRIGHQFFHKLAAGTTEAQLRQYLSIAVEHGVSPSVVLDKFENTLTNLFETGTDATAGEGLRLLNFLLASGLSLPVTQQWLDEAIRSDNYLMEYIFMNPQEVAPFSLSLKPYTQIFLNRCGKRFIQEGDFGILTRVIPITDIIENFTIKDMGLVDYDTLDAFLTDYQQADGNLVTLTEKFLVEIGYDGDFDNATMLMLLVDTAEDPAVDALIDFSQFAASVDAECLENYEKESFHAFFSEHGVPDEIIAKFQ